MSPFIKSFLLIIIVVAYSCTKKHVVEISGEMKKWHKVTLTFTGPETSEADSINPFMDYRLTVEFSNGDERFTVPGFYAADGNASETSSESGNKWQVRFTPNKEGEWTFTTSFRQGNQIAISDEIDDGKSVYFDGATGTFQIAASDKQGNDFRAKGKLNYNGTRYLQFAETGEYFLKGGADSPENFLGYEDFDGTFYQGDNKQRMGEAAPNASLHAYANHIKDWKEGDPVWKEGKGKAMIGALNYLSSKGMNSVYFLTLNIEGDGRDVWPYTGYDERYRFDCSKLDQWEKVFTHMDQLGLMLHIVTQETENELLLDKGDVGPQRRLYYRELIARFSHHLAITWNMGEENGFADFTPEAQNRKQQMAMVRYFKEHDPYQNFTVIHTHANEKYRYEIFEELLGYEFLDGPSMQLGNPLNTHNETLTWLRESNKSGKQWVVNIDEIGPHWRGADPDDRTDLNNQDSIRSFVLWANLMAGGGGVEWYFGYKNHNDDLKCEDWRSRDRLWDYTKYGLDFFQNYLPFNEMEPADELTNNGNAYCLAKTSEIYAVYFPQFSSTMIDLSENPGAYSVQWYNPRQGGNLQEGSLIQIEGGQPTDIGNPPEEGEGDWAVIIKKI